MATTVQSVAGIYHELYREMAHDIEAMPPGTDAKEWRKSIELHSQLTTMCDVLLRTLAEDIAKAVLPMMQGIRRLDAMPTPDEMREYMRAIHERLCVEFGKRV